MLTPKLLTCYPVGMGVEGRIPPRRLASATGLGALLLGVGVWACSTGGAPQPASDAGATTSTPEVDGGDAGPIRAPHGLDVRPPNPGCVASPRPASGGAAAFELVTSMPQLFGAMMIAQPPGDRTRWFVAFRDGRLGIWSPASPATPPVIVADLGVLAGAPVDTNGEGGFLGLAFHPKFAQNGRLYVSWTSADGALAPGMRSRVGVLTSQDGGASFSAYSDVLSFDQPDTNHNGGGIAFGLDGFLYASFGEGGTTQESGQKTTTFFSKVLRIDVDGPKAPGLGYGIPPDNPFAQGGGEPAAFAYGFRNPFRFSFDRATGALWLGDVGATKWEEINVVEKGGNYGWPCVEGNEEYWGQHPLFCPKGLTNLASPLHVYEHTAPYTYRAVTGGVVYRGKAVASLVGAYVFADYMTQELFALERDPKTGEPVVTRLDENGPKAFWVHLAEDVDGEIFALHLHGAIYRMKPAPGGAGGAAFPERLSKTGCTSSSDPARPAVGLVPYDVNAPFWSDGADKARWLAIPDGSRIAVGPDGHLALPNGSVLLKTFSIGGRRVETRLLVRHEDGEWAGYSYEWLDDQSDAVLLPSSKRKRVGGQDWYFPSRGECVLCHTEPAGRTLGLEVAQLNREVLYPTTNRISNQLATLEHIGMLEASVGDPAKLPVLPDPVGAASLASRARAYLHVNCAGCHRPGVSRVDMDLRFDTPLAATKTCGVPGSSGDLGVTGALRVTPGSPATSLVSIRPHSRGFGRMPPLGLSAVDHDGLAVVDAWISAISSCP